MRVVLVCDPGFVDGGASKVAIASARALADTGVAVVFVCALGPVAAELNHPRIQTHCLNIASVWDQSNAVAAAAQGIWNARALAGLDSILADLAPEDTVVHFHQWTKSFSPSVLAAPSRHGMASVVSLHDYFLACPNGAYYRFPAAVPCKQVPMSGGCLTARCDSRSSWHKAVRVARQLATQRALAQAGESLSVLSVSPFAEQVIDSFLPRRHRRFILRSPIDIAREEPVAVRENSQFVFVGRMTEEKGVRQLARAARDAGLPVTFVGDGPLLEEIRGFGPSIRCTGWLAASQLGDMMRQARALIFPSTWYETGGLVVLEALARGVPVVVSRTTAPADFVTHGENGYLVDAFDAEALRARLLDLTDDAIAARMGRQAYARYWANPQTAEAHVAGLLEIYRTMLTEHRQRPCASAA